MEFISKRTKIPCIVASVLTGLSLIILVMLSSLLTMDTASRTLMCFIYTVTLMFILLIWQGILQIKVFNDYKCKNIYLCADGILTLCMGALIIVSGILFGSLQANKVLSGAIISTADIRIFLTCFLGIIGF